MILVRRVQTQCWLLETTLRVALSAAIAWSILVPLQDSNLLSSVRSDTRLLSHGATLLATVWANGLPELERQALGIIAILLAGWLCKIVVGALVFGATVGVRSPVSRENTLAALQLVIPFAFVSLSLMTAVTALLFGFVVFLPLVGIILTPLLGERGTDLTELGLLGLVGLLTGVIVLVAELSRMHLAQSNCRLRLAISSALKNLRYRFGAILVGLAPRALPAFAVYVVALGLHLRWQRNPTLYLAPLRAVTVVELAAALATWLYLDWLFALKRLCHEAINTPTPPLNDNDGVYGNDD